MPQLTEAMVPYPTEVDHDDHEAIIALEGETGEGFGVVRYVRGSGRRDAAEFAVTVIDDWQRRGLGTLLLEVISARAREEGNRDLHRADAGLQPGDDGRSQEPRLGAGRRPGPRHG